MNALITSVVNNKLNDIVTGFFEGNRICDRAMSVLDVKFVMNKSSSILHEKLAHLFPKMADVVSDYQGSRNCLTVYGLTPLDDMDYATPQDFFDRILSYIIDMESLCYETYDMAMKESDITTASFIMKFMKPLSVVTNQCILLVDKGRAYNGDWMRFDHDIDDFVFLSGLVSSDKPCIMTQEED